MRGSARFIERRRRRLGRRRGGGKRTNGREKRGVSSTPAVRAKTSPAGGSCDAPIFVKQDIKRRYRDNGVAATTTA